MINICISCDVKNIENLYSRFTLKKPNEKQKHSQIIKRTFICTCILLICNIFKSFFLSAKFDIYNKSSAERGNIRPLGFLV